MEEELLMELFERQKQSKPKHKDADRNPKMHVGGNGSEEGFFHRSEDQGN